MIPFVLGPQYRALFLAGLMRTKGKTAQRGFAHFKIRIWGCLMRDRVRLKLIGSPSQENAKG